MQIIAQIAFVVIAFVAIFLFAKKAAAIKRNILIGKAEDLTDQPAQRWKNMALLALGQQKMFKNPLVAFLHLAVYAGFIIINIEVLEIVLDGILGTHRLFNQPVISGLYVFLINCFETLALLVVIACVAFLARRNWIKLKRFVHNDLTGWPKSDANYILITEIVLMSLFLFMNAADQVLQDRSVGHYGEHTTGALIVSQWLKPLLNQFSDSTLIGIERSCWWLHIIGIFAFLNYLPYSKHLHIILAFPNAYFARLTPTGAMKNMPEVEQEVKYMLDPSLVPAESAAPARFGARDVMDLSWKNLLDAYSCTECGRCTAACPANSTGKLLSPRKIMMATRDRLEEVGKIMDANKGEFIADNKSLLHDYITTEELRACTTCNACVEECPVSISPLDIIQQLRRSLVMEESNAPQEWNMMFGNIENNFAPWKFSPDERDKWTTEMNA